MAFSIRRVDWGTVAIGLFSLWMAYMSQVGQSANWIIYSFAALGVVLILFALRQAGLGRSGQSPG